MIVEPQAIWCIRAGKDGGAHELFTGENVIALNWQEVGQLDHLPTDLETFRRASKKALDLRRSLSKSVKAIEPHHFVWILQEGDLVIYPVKGKDTVLLGRVSGPYEFHPASKVGFPHRRNVDWLSTFRRQDLSNSARKEISRLSSFFQITGNADEFRNAVHGSSTGNAQDLDYDEMQRSVALIYAPEINPSTFLHFSWKTDESHDGAAIRDYFDFTLNPERPDRSRNPKKVRSLIASDIETGELLFLHQLGPRPNRTKVKEWQQRIQVANEAHDVTIRYHLSLLSGVDGTSDLQPRSEGAVRYALHLVRERSLALVEDVKERFKVQHGGRLFCAVCGFDFAEQYGDHGDGFIEMHHTIPVSQLEPGGMTHPKDCILLCSNCHRMVHRRGGLLGPDGLRGRITKPWG